MTRPVQPPEGRLLRLARESHRPRKLSVRSAARRAGVSESHWRHVEAGYEPKGGMEVPVRAAASTLARMAQAVGVTPDQLTGTGRADAAESLRELRQQPADDLEALEAELGVDLSMFDPEQRRTLLKFARVIDERSAGRDREERRRGA